MPLPAPEPETGRAAALAAKVAERAAADGTADVAYALVDSPCGEIVVATTKQGLARLSYTDHPGGLDRVLESLSDRLSPRVVEAPAKLDDWRRQLDDYFEGRRQDFDGPVDWSLTDGYVREVLQATARIPYGETSTYKLITEQTHAPKAYRACGGALGSNPIAIVVPCHRVLASGGKMGGYTGGLERKEILLGVEGVLPSKLV